MAYENDVMNTVQATLDTSVQDTVLKASPFLQLVAEKASIFTGREKQVNFKVSKNTGNGGSFAKGDTLASSLVSTTQVAKFEPRFARQSVQLDDIDISAANGKEAIIELQELKTEEASQELADTVAPMIFSDGTGNSGKDLIGLKAAIKTSGTYGGLDYATYTSLKSTVDTVTTLSTLTIAKLDAVHDAISQGNYKPTHIFTTQAIKTKIGAIQTTANMYVVNQAPTKIMSKTRDGLEVEIGVTNVFYRGIPVIADPQCPDNHLFIINADDWQLYVQPMKSAGEDVYTPVGISSSVVKGEFDKNLEMWFKGISRTKFERPTNALYSVAHYVFNGMLICKNPSRQGMFTALA